MYVRMRMRMRMRMRIFLFLFFLLYEKKLISNDIYNTQIYIYYNYIFFLNTLI